MKKVISGISALAIMATMAAPMSAFADTPISEKTTAKTGSFVVSYDAPQVFPAYTITIPASIDLNDTERTATIKAENVYLDTTKHKQINVTLDSASHTTKENGTKFHAMNAKEDSIAEYTINNGTKDIAVGDTVAEFTADDTATLTFSEPTGATYAGTHTETLTFGISVEDAPPAAAARLSNGFLYTYPLVNDLMSLTGDYSEWGKYFNGNGTLKYTLTEDEAKSCAEYFGEKSIVVYNGYLENGWIFYKYAMNNNGTISTDDSIFVFFDSNKDDWSKFSGFNFYLPIS